ncbi:MAG: YkvA family protein, partial [Adhaeribacter sp.]
RQVSTKTVLIGLATVLYLLLPIDLVPDFIPVLGLMDDLSLITWFIKAFQQELVKFQQWESTQALPA